MKIIINNYVEKKKPRRVSCPHCTSQLEITDADICQIDKDWLVLCPCCQSHFPVMTREDIRLAYEIITADYTK